MAKRLAILTCTVSLLFTTHIAFASPSTLDQVLTKGKLTCGISTGLAGFSDADGKGQWQGLDVDYCRAVAAAVLGDKNKVEFIPLTARERFQALQSGLVDVVSRNTTWTFERDTTMGLNFVGVNFYDGQGFMVNKKSTITQISQLHNQPICVQSETTTKLNLDDYFRHHNMSYQPVVFDTAIQIARAFNAGRCVAITGDQSGLYALRLNLAKPDSAIILPEIISKEPLGPVIREGDDRWLNITRWTLAAMINAEELGITSANVDQKRTSTNPEIRRLLGVEGDIGQPLGLNSDWAYQVIKQVGNYDESFQRNVGEDSPLAIPRGLNALWNAGGIIYAPPIR
ncbi:MULTISPECIES: amino acid ABC transporter substrate-binding protein [unclassified Vibrio]|uniref:amino acid ABC transporter substrate-binding protein n=1 Tax=unclassified Vibrio TaxID=2614977 RepID=UPI001482B8D1|nr:MULTISPECIES: amino acid ABC transporter substrate-binding protein [unclassified Vibrio]NNN43662.1 amino acid ABC transporter substrate-binding protein [Vibrio sp. 1-1(7)]NNN71486.1 amino acid ABC transporter substrate-binding protein [Vibrio sp. 12-2(3-a)]